MADIVRLEENGVQKFLETHVKAVNGLDELLSKTGKVIFSGASYFMETQRYSFNLDEVKESIVFVFGRYTPGTGALGYGYHIVEIPKSDIKKRSRKMRFTLLGMGGTPTFKQFHVSENEVWGHKDNAEGDRASWCIEEIYLN